MSVAEDRFGWEMETYSERAQLSGTALLQDSDDLRDLARDTHHAGASLEVAQRLHVEYSLAKQRDGAGRQSSDKQGGQACPPAVVEYKDGDDDILAEHESGLAESAEGEAFADVVGKRDQVAAGLKQVREEGHAASGLRSYELDDLRHLDNRRGGDDADAEGLADGELEALGVAGIDIKDQSLVAGIANERHAKITDRTREVVRDRLEGGTERVHLEELRVMKTGSRGITRSLGATMR